MTTDPPIETVRERIDGYVTALMVDGGANVRSCEKAMNEAVDALARRLEAAETTLREIAGTTNDGMTGIHFVGDEIAQIRAECPGCIARAYFAAHPAAQAAASSSSAVGHSEGSSSRGVE